MNVSRNQKLKSITVLAGGMILLFQNCGGFSPADALSVQSGSRQAASVAGGVATGSLSQIGTGQTTNGTNNSANGSLTGLGSGTHVQTITASGVTEQNAMKLFLVVDNSGTMSQPHQKVVAGLDQLLQSLASYNVDVYVTSTSPRPNEPISPTPGQAQDAQPTAPQSYLLGFGPRESTETSLYSTAWEYLCLFGGNIVAGSACNTSPTSGHRLLGRSVLHPSIASQVKKVRTSELSGSRDLVLSEIRKAVLGLGLDGEDTEMGMVPLYHTLSPIKPLFKRGDKVGYIVISDENDKSDTFVAQAEYGYRPYLVPGYVSYSGAYPSCDFAFSYMRDVFNDGIPLGQQLTQLAARSYSGGASCSGTCVSMDMSYAQQQSGGKPILSCTYLGIRERNWSYADKDVSRENRNLCTSSFSINGSSYTNLLQHQANSLSLPDTNGVTCNKGVSVAENQWLGPESTWDWSSLRRLPFLNPDIQGPIERYTGTQVLASAMNLADQFIARADLVLGRGNYVYSAITTLRDGCALQTAQTYGDRYIEVASKLGSAGRSLSICSNDYRPALQFVGSSLQTIVVDRYSIDVQPGRQIMSVTRQRGGVSTLLQPGVHYTYSGGALQFTSGVLQLNDVLTIVIQ